MCTRDLVVAIAMALAASSCGNGGASRLPPPTPSAATPIPSATPTPMPITVVPSVIPSAAFGVAASDRGYLVSFTNDEPELQVFGVRLGADGTVLDQTPFLISAPFVNPSPPLLDTTVADPAPAFAGESFAVAWSAGATAGQSGPPARLVSATSVSEAGKVADPTIVVRADVVRGCQAYPLAMPALAAATAEGFVAVWPENGCTPGGSVARLRAALLANDGETFAVTPIDGLVSNPDPSFSSSAASVASSASATVATWTEAPFDSAATQLVAAVIAPGEVQRTSLGSALAGRVRPSIASDGEGFLIVWLSTLDGAHPAQTIRGARFRPGSGALDGDGGFVIEGADGPLGAPRVAFGGGAYLVVWTAEGEGAASGIRAARVDPSGAVEPPGPWSLRPRFSSPDVAVTFGNDAFLVAYLVYPGRPLLALQVVLLPTS